MRKYCLELCLSSQENYFGSYQFYRDFDARSLSKIKRSVISEDVDNNDTSMKDNDPLSLRPMEANVLVNLCSIRAEMTQVHSSAFCTLSFFFMLASNRPFRYNSVFLQLVIT